MKSVTLPLIYAMFKQITDQICSYFDDRSASSLLNQSFVIWQNWRQQLGTTDIFTLCLNIVITDDIGDLIVLCLVVRGLFNTVVFYVEIAHHFFVH